MIRSNNLPGVVGLAMTALAGVVYLLGGVTEVCQHLSPLLGVGYYLRAKASIWSRIGMVAAYDVCVPAPTAVLLSYY
jgi:hypothetical protein